ncbi:MAG: ATP-binding protein [Deltaproteobacteria bacterium CG2_30_63_29]|nr:MAG: ATP-binding protein [Deltaproteobacteria bacterium CG2_30_63_29]PIW01163.1 MAG: MoxR family ATPase [Deltaproteobacteria bacterium CG17_big_fil_post_rev_8_21_14_2_50_63_7]PJB44366.1 MAG: MoxR family ATPase [Deltaproteobacteria bacterium CG_4_9_14_3_um_filter_63_12]
MSVAEFNRFSGTPNYIASSELSDAVNVSVALRRPLLIKGEPGTGKTLLARAISESLGAPLLSWHVKSTTRAGDGLYVYDTVQRLNDSRFGGADVSDIGNYIKLGPLGQAFASEREVVLLIDEVDKADMEFPNDLLHELDEMQFTIVETNQTIRAAIRPIVVITSNAEKELPDAFLRRCVFHYIAFPDRDLMETIVRVHHPSLDDALLEACMKRFYWIREQPEIRKRPSTSELVDWLSALVRGGVSKDRVLDSFPFLGVLLKKETDVQVITQARPKTMWSGR